MLAHVDSDVWIDARAIGAQSAAASLSDEDAGQAESPCSALLRSSGALAPMSCDEALPFVCETAETP